MKSTIFRVKRSKFISRTYPVIFAGIVAGGITRNGILPLSNFWVYFMGSTVSIVALVCLPLKTFDVVLSDNDLCAPVRRGIWFKSTSVALSEIVLSKSLADWVRGSQVATRDGQILRISFPFYGKKEKQHLITEIKLRQARQKGVTH